MRRMPWTIYLWPGLPQIWLLWKLVGLGFGPRRGSLAGRVGAGQLRLDGTDRPEICVIHFGSLFVVAWIVAIVWSSKQCRRQAVVGSLEPEEDSFGQAIDYYLKGDAYQAEQILEGLLRRNIRDVDARLMLATLLRRARRLDEATRQLDTLASFEAAGKWELEIQEERDLLAEARTRRRRPREQGVCVNARSVL